MKKKKRYWSDYKKLLGRVSHITHDWLTPVEYLPYISALLGEIDLDPCSTHNANAQFLKARKIYSGLKTWEYNNDVIKHMDKTDIDNPMYDAAFSGTEAVTNLPLSRLYNKYQNVKEAANSDDWHIVATINFRKKR